MQLYYGMDQSQGVICHPSGVFVQLCTLLLRHWSKQP